MDDDDIPVSLGLLAEQVFQDAPEGDYAEFRKTQQELLESLQRFGMAAECKDSLQDSSALGESHQCPYPLTRFSGIAV